MKKVKFANKLIALAIAVTTMVGVMSPVGVMASETKTATLNDVKVSVNGAEPVTMQAYNVDGFNYFRIRDICEPLDIAVMPAHNGKDGTLLIPQDPYEGTELPKLTQPSVVVDMKTTQLYYAGVPVEASCFNVNDTNFFKLQDVEKASDYKVELGKDDTIASPPLKTISVDYNEATSTILLNTSVVDSTTTAMASTQATGVQSPVVTQKPIAPVVTPVATTAPIVAQAPLTSPPVVGSFPAKILIDPSKGAYDPNHQFGNGTTIPYSIGEYPLMENYTETYTNGNIGQCMWYARARFEEVTGIEFLVSDRKQTMVQEAKDGEHEGLTGITDVNKIVAPSMAIFDSHVVFVEYVEYDSNGNPVNVYFTEANGYATEESTNGLASFGSDNNKYDPTEDGMVQVLSLEDFINRSSGNLNGYIVPAQ